MLIREDCMDVPFSLCLGDTGAPETPNPYPAEREDKKVTEDRSRRWKEMQAGGLTMVGQYVAPKGQRFSQASPQISVENFGDKILCLSILYYINTYGV